MQTTQKNLPTAISLVKAHNNQNKNPANQHFIGTRAKQSPRARKIQSQVTKTAQVVQGKDIGTCTV